MEILKRLIEGSFGEVYLKLVEYNVYRIKILR